MGTRRQCQCGKALQPAFNWLGKAVRARGPWEHPWLPAGPLMIRTAWQLCPSAARPQRHLSEPRPRGESSGGDHCVLAKRRQCVLGLVGNGGVLGTPGMVGCGGGGAPGCRLGCMCRGKCRPRTQGIPVPLIGVPKSEYLSRSWPVPLRKDPGLAHGGRQAHVLGAYGVWVEFLWT